MRVLRISSIFSDLMRWRRFAPPLPFPSILPMPTLLCQGYKDKGGSLFGRPPFALELPVTTGPTKRSEEPKVEVTVDDRRFVHYLSDG